MEVALPEVPTAGMSAEDTVHAVCGGLQNNDSPKEDAGIERFFHFLTPMGRVSVAPPPPRSGLQGGVTLEYFVENAASKALGALMFCESYTLIGKMRISPGSRTRGCLGTQVVEVANSPLEDESDARAALTALVDAMSFGPSSVVNQGRTRAATVVVALAGGGGGVAAASSRACILFFRLSIVVGWAAVGRPNPNALAC